MTYIILILLITFLSLVNSMNLGWVIVELVDLPAYYYSSALFFLLVLKVLMWLEGPFYAIRRLVRKLARWIDDEDQTGPGASTPGSGSRNRSGTQTRSYSTSAGQVGSPKKEKPRGKLHTTKPGFLDRLRQKVLIRNRVSSAVVITTRKINDTFRVKAVGLLAGAFERMLPAMSLERTQSKISSILRFIAMCKQYHKANGMKGLVLALKAGSVLLTQALGGFRLRDIGDLKFRLARNKSGLPRKWIPRQDRAKIRAGDTRVMKFYLSLFALYRVLEFPGVLKFSTITDPMRVGPSTSEVLTLLKGYAPIFASMLLKIRVRPLGDRSIKPAPILKSAPSTYGTHVSTTPQVVLFQYFALRSNGLLHLLDFFITFFERKKTRAYETEFLAGYRAIGELPPFLPLFPHAALTTFSGKLGVKHEAAGKERVFAMVDAWTQWSLEPFHSWLFDILSHIPMDGTFDQMAPVRAALEKKFPCAYSLDLSAATDRLPIEVQEYLVAALVNPEFARNWRAFLVGREYAYKGEAFTYSVGQPMGALSSWSMLATVHHFLVQAAAWKAGVVPVGTWFKAYAVLGDDIVIFNRAVKDAYMWIMDGLGVSMGIAKSLLSSKGTALEFAKRVLYKGVDVSPIALTEFVAANLTVSEAAQFARKYSLTFSQLLRCLGYGYSVRSSINRHISALNSRVRALFFAFHLPVDAVSFQALMDKGNPIFKELETRDLVNNQFVKSLLAYLQKEIARFNKIKPETRPHWVTQKELVFPKVPGLNMAKVFGAFLGGVAKPKTVSKDGLITYEFKPKTPVEGPTPNTFGKVYEPFKAGFRRWLTALFLGQVVFELLPGAMKHFSDFKWKALQRAPLDKDLLSETSKPGIVTLGFFTPAIMRILIDFEKRLAKIADAIVAMIVLPSFNKRVHAMIALNDAVKDLAAQVEKGALSPWDAFSKVLELLKEFAAIGEEIQIERIEPPIPWRQDPLMAKFWKLYTTAILAALKEYPDKFGNIQWGQRLRKEARLQNKVPTLTNLGGDGKNAPSP